MNGEVVPQTEIERERLIALLDPARNYGKRTYEQVVAGIREGTLVIQPGQRLPVLRGKQTNLAIHGTGYPVRVEDGGGPQQIALRKFREMALDDLDQAYAWLIGAMRPSIKFTAKGEPVMDPERPGEYVYEVGDARYFKVFFENLLGKVGEARVSDEMGRFLQQMLERIDDAPRTRTVVVDG